MAVSTADSLECVICKGNLSDPRPLPCGHSYCGPPRLCLATLRNEDGGLRCAVCCIDHNLKVDEIKPLYGIRDFFRGSSNFDTEEFSRLPCTAHPNKDFTFWCSTCSVMVCDDCVECEHDDHCIRKLKKYLEMKFEREVGKPVHEGIAEYKNFFGEMIESTLSELERCKLNVQSMERKLQLCVHRKELLDQYCWVSKENSANIPAKENLLIKFLQTGIVDSKLSKNTDKLEQTSFEQDIASESNQTVDVVIQSSVDTASSAVASSNETACSRDLTTIAEKDNDVETVSPQVPKSDAQASSRTVSFDNRTSDCNLSKGNRAVAETEIKKCSCGFIHVIKTYWSAPIIFSVIILVKRREPPEFGLSSQLFVCPFQFVVEPQLVRGTSRKYEMFQIILKCFRTCEKYRMSCPKTTFIYIIELTNMEARDKNRMKNGIWSDPESNNIIFDALSYSQLMSRREHWIGKPMTWKHEYIKITLWLKRIR